ncbi:RND family efflux transporter, MFP subunit [Spirosomataceae bacterium TFI 002]|nr:RND family efflux transporter, MFP subunit [Spirosomataceae bacterium TFI 002]
MNRLLILVLLLTFNACRTESTKEEKVIEAELIAVTITNVQKSSIQDNIVASGVLSSKEELKLAFKTGGLIKRMLVSEGQFVKAGQLLAELDMSEIDAQVNQAQLGFQKSQRDLERVKKLVEDEAATQTNLDDATTGFELAQQGLQVAKYNQKLSKIYAPQSGRILRKISEAGELITPFAPAIIMGTGSSAFLLNVGLSDRDIVKVKKGYPAKVSLDAYPGRVFDARVTQLAEMINPATGTFEAELTLEKISEKLISGFVAKATITPPGQQLVLSVPIESLVEANGTEAYVFLYENGVAKKQAIITGRIGNEKVEVLAGLSENQEIISQGANFLSNGQKVKAVNP